MMEEEQMKKIKTQVRFVRGDSLVFAVTEEEVEEEEEEGKEDEDEDEDEKEEGRAVLMKSDRIY